MTETTAQMSVIHTDDSDEANYLMSAHIPVQIGVVELGRMGANLPHRSMRDGRRNRESTASVAADAAAVVGAHWGNCTELVIGVPQGQFSRIHAVPTLAAETENGRLVSGATAAGSFIERHHGARSVGLCDDDAAIPKQFGDGTVYLHGQVADRLRQSGRRSS
jgi:6-phosphogluconate dehydrogenase (decarboxylating)